MDDFSVFEFNETVIYHDDACRQFDWSTSAGSVKFHYIALPIIIIFGLVCNALNITVFSSRELRVVPSNVYLLALAVSHSLYLLATFFLDELPALHCWLSPSTATHRGMYICALLHCISSQAVQFSTWMILAFAVDRSIAAFTPMFYKRRCSVVSAWCVTVVLFVVTAAITAPFRTAFARMDATCVLIMKSNLMYVAMIGVEWILGYFLLAIIIVALDELIIIHMCLASRSKKHNFLMSSENESDGETGDSPRAEIEHTEIGTVQPASENRTRKYHQSDDERNSQLSVILILISVACIVLRAPMALYWLLSATLQLDVDVMLIVGRCCVLLETSCFAVNLLLYTLSGSIFREQLKTMCRCGNRGVQRDSSSTV